MTKIWSPMGVPVDPQNPDAPEAVPVANGAVNSGAQAVPARQDAFSDTSVPWADGAESLPRAATRAGCPHRSAAEKAEAAKKIPCPALSAMFTSDMMPTAEDGTVQIEDLDKAFSELGISRAVRRILTHLGDSVGENKGSFNLFQLNTPSLLHTGSSGIRHNGVHPKRFDVLVKFSKDGKRLTPSDLAEASRHFERESPGLRGAIMQLAETALLLETFGQRDENNHPYFTIDDARKLWVDGQFPDSWRRPSGPDAVRLDQILARLAQMKASQIF